MKLVDVCVWVFFKTCFYDFLKLFECLAFKSLMPNKIKFLAEIAINKLAGTKAAIATFFQWVWTKSKSISKNNRNQKRWNIEWNELVSAKAPKKIAPSTILKPVKKRCNCNAARFSKNRTGYA